MIAMQETLRSTMSLPRLALAPVSYHLHLHFIKDIKMVSFLLQENLDPEHYVGWRSDADPRVQRTSRDRDGKAEPSSQAKGPSIAIQVLI